MSLVSRISDAFTRVGVELKATRATIAAKYTKPVDGIPLADLTTEVQAGVAPLAPPGPNFSGVLGGVKNPAGVVAVPQDDPFYFYATIGVSPDGEMSSLMLLALVKAFNNFLSGVDMETGGPLDSGQQIDRNGLQPDVQDSLGKADAAQPLFVDKGAYTPSEPNYPVGSIVTQNHGIWLCKTAITASEAFTPSKWIYLGLNAVAATSNPGGGRLWIDVS